MEIVGVVFNDFVLDVFNDSILFEYLIHLCFSQINHVTLNYGVDIILFELIGEIHPDYITPF